MAKATNFNLDMLNDYSKHYAKM